jgi:hypothetical protein
MLRHALWIATLIGCVDATREPDLSANRPSADAPLPTPRTWRPIDNQPLMNTPAFAPAVGGLLTDGSVIFNDPSEATGHWFKLSPDELGSYEHGTWKQLASTAGYAPLYYGSATLTDGRYIVEGGEYLNFNAVWTTKGAIYDPVADKWTTMAPPPGWQTIGDASGIVLADGTYMQSDCCNNDVGLAALDPASLTWTVPIGTGKADGHDEESWAMMWDGRIVTVDANNVANPDRSEIYDPVTRLWTGHGDVPVDIADHRPFPNASTGSHEVGPEILRADGKVLAIGGTGHNALYDPVADSWTAMPDLPGANQSEDGPGVMMPNGDILLAISPFPMSATQPFNPPTTFYELHDTTFTQVGASANGANIESYQNFFLMLPTGEVMLSDSNGSIELYTPAPGVVDNGIPSILAAPKLIGDGPEAETGSTITMYRGRSYTLPVYRMNGISQGAYYGDDAQMSTNFPVVRVTNNASGHVAFFRTYDHSNRSISPDSSGVTKLDVPTTADQGLSSLVVIANGIASAPITVNVK